MNASLTTGTPAAARAARIGRVATPLITAWLVALLILGAMMEAGDAKKSPGS
jgi:hypothetical protein